VQSPLIAQRFKDVDLVLSCGDLPFEYLEYVVTMLCKPLFYVSGNHVQRDVISSDGVVKNKPEGCVDIHRRVVHYRGLLIAGIEGSMRYSEGDHQYTDGQMSMLAATMAPLLVEYLALRSGHGYPGHSRATSRHSRRPGSLPPGVSCLPGSDGPLQAALS